MGAASTIADAPQSLAQSVHDLRTPLNHIVGFSEMLFELAAEEGRHDLKEGLAIVRNAGLELSKLLEDYQRLSRETAIGKNFWPLIDSVRPAISRIKSFLDLTWPELSGTSLHGYAGDLQKISAATDEFLEQVNKQHLLILLDDPLPPLAPQIGSQDRSARHLAGRVLIIDDEILNREILCRRLRREGCEPTGVRGGREALALLQLETFDAVLLDIIMPEMSGLEVLQILKNDPRWFDLPVIMLSALTDVDRAAHCIELGAEDYLPKPVNTVLLRARLGATLEKKRLRDQDRRNLQALHAEKERLSVTLGSLADAVVATDAMGRIMLLNEAAERLTSRPADQAIGRPFAEVFAIYRREGGAELASPPLAAITSNAAHESGTGLALLLPQGSERSISVRCAPIHAPAGEVLGTVVILRDITEQEKLAEELLRSSKLQSIGVLAGGLAHDFNNMLTAILGNLSLMRHLHIPQELVPLTNEVERGARRACELAQYLLTFAEGGLPRKEVLQPGRILEETVSFTRRSFNTAVKSELAPDLWRIEADPNQLMQVVSHIVMNALEATNDDGDILLSAANIAVEAGALAGLPAGDYIRVSICDHGEGILPANLPLIYDPFFTTKKHARGLGLAAAYSIIHRHGGKIVAESMVGVGTTVSFYLPGIRWEATLPAVDAPSPPIEPAESFTAEEQRRQRVLLMDDEEPIRTLASMMLGLLNYDVLAVPGGEEAIAAHAEARLSGQPFDIFISDLNISGGMGGREAIRIIRQSDNDMVAIVSSGYSNDEVMANYQRYGFDGVLPKPYLFENMSALMKSLQREAATYPSSAAAR